MSKLLNEHRREHADILRDMRALHDKAEKAKRALTDDEKSRWDAMQARADSLRESIGREQMLADEELRLSRPVGEQRDGGPAAAGADRGVEIRSGADWARLFPEQDGELRAAFEGGRFGLVDFVRGIAGMKTSEIAHRVLSIGTDSAGGFAVPTILMPGIMDALVPVSSLLTAGASFVNVEEDMGPSGGKSYNWPAISTLPTAAWRSENGNVAESDPVFRNVTAVPRSLSFMFRLSRELLADAMGLEQALRRAIAAAFARELDRAGLRGSGTAPEPRGILNTSGIQPVTNGANGASLASLRFANLMTATQAVLAADAPMPTAAIMSPRSLIGFGNLADTTNQPLQRPGTISQMQFIATSQVPNALTVGTSNDCTELYVGDFRTVRFVLRERPSIQLLVERYADAGQLAFVCHTRVDVIVTYPAALAVVTGVRP